MGKGNTVMMCAGKCPKRQEIIQWDCVHSLFELNHILRLMVFNNSKSRSKYRVILFRLWNISLYILSRHTLFIKGDSSNSLHSIFKLQKQIHFMTTSIHDPFQIARLWTCDTHMYKCYNYLHRTGQRRTNRSPNFSLHPRWYGWYQPSIHLHSILLGTSRRSLLYRGTYCVCEKRFHSKTWKRCGY